MCDICGVVRNGNREVLVRRLYTSFDDEHDKYACNKCYDNARDGKCCNSRVEPDWDGFRDRINLCTRNAIFVNPLCCNRDKQCDQCGIEGCEHTTHPYEENRHPRYIRAVDKVVCTSMRMHTQRTMLCNTCYDAHVEAVEAEHEAALEAAQLLKEDGIEYECDVWAQDETSYEITAGCSDNRVT